LYPGAQEQVKPLSAFSPNARLLNPESVVVKCEPDFTIVECNSPAAPSARNISKNQVGVHHDTKPIPNTPKDMFSPSTCVATRNSSITCSKEGHYVDLNKLTSYVDMTTNRYIVEGKEGLF
jgi:hypothetical protein